MINRSALIQSPQSNKNTFNLDISKFAIISFLTRIIRVYNKDYLFNDIISIKESLKKNQPLALWFIEICINQNILNEFIFYCPVSVVIIRKKGKYF